jgi:hypothetical protein
MRGTTTQRGYGSDHQQRRSLAKREVDTGTVACWRCGRLIDPDQPWHLGHDDADRNIYRGPEHARCNLATATPGRATAARRRVTAALRRGTRPREYRTPPKRAWTSDDQP